MSPAIQFISHISPLPLRCHIHVEPQLHSISTISLSQPCLHAQSCRLRATPMPPRQAQQLIWPMLQLLLRHSAGPTRQHHLQCQPLFMRAQRRPSCQLQLLTKLTALHRGQACQSKQRQRTAQMSVRPQPLPLHQSSGAKALHLELQVTLNALAGRACTSVKAVQTYRVCRAVNDLSKETPVTETGSGFAGSPDYAKGTGIFEGEAEVLNDDNALRVRPLLFETRRDRTTWLWRPYMTSCSCLTRVIPTSV